MNIISQLELQLNFSQSEKVLAQYILKNGEKVLNLNTKELAKNTYTSPATVVRFCQKLGLKGYSEFKIKFSADLKSELNINSMIDVNYPFVKGDTINTITFNLQSLYNEVIEDTLNLINIEEIEKVVNLLFKTDIIYVFGVGTSVLAALDFENKMSRIGAKIQIKIIESEQFISICNATEKDACIFISYTGETQNTVSIAEIAKQKNIPVIAITSVGKNTLSSYADYIINTSSRENLYNKIATFSSKISIEFILDIIFSIYFNKDYDKHLNYKVNPAKKIEKRKIQSPIVNEK